MFNNYGLVSCSNLPVSEFFTYIIMLLLQSHTKLKHWTKRLSYSLQPNDLWCHLIHNKDGLVSMTLSQIYLFMKTGFVWLKRNTGISILNKSLLTVQRSNRVAGFMIWGYIWIALSATDELGKNVGLYFAKLPKH